MSVWFFKSVHMFCKVLLGLLAPWVHESEHVPFSTTFCLFETKSNTVVQVHLEFTLQHVEFLYSYLLAPLYWDCRCLPAESTVLHKETKILFSVNFWIFSSWVYSYLRNRVFMNLSEHFILIACDWTWVETVKGSNLPGWELEAGYTSHTVLEDKGILGASWLNNTWAPGLMTGQGDLSIK